MPSLTVYQHTQYYGEAPCKYNDYVDCNNGDIKRNKCKKCGWCPTEAHRRKVETRRLRRLNNPKNFIFQYPSEV